jgi:hypothetical protein
MSAVAANWGGKPLVEPRMHHLAKKYNHVRIRDCIKSGGPNMFAPAGRTNNDGGGLFGQTRDATDDDMGPTHSRKISGVPGARSMIPPASRKASMALAMGA